MTEGQPPQILDDRPQHNRESPSKARTTWIHIARWLATASLLALGTAGCGDPEPTLLQQSDFDGVVESHHERDYLYTPGPVWCSDLSLGDFTAGRVPANWFKLDDGASVGATVLDQGAPLTEPLEYVLDHLEKRAAACADEAAADADKSFEPLTGLGDGAMGWRTRLDSDGELWWGEYAVMPLDETHLLAVGFETHQEKPPVELDELIRLARAGAKRVGTAG